MIDSRGQRRNCENVSLIGLKDRAIEAELDELFDSFQPVEHRTSERKKRTDRLQAFPKRSAAPRSMRGWQPG
ncbi:hypothetical protein [Sinorhizobium meliloti]|uniref:hypothetical protein n=1 Tax=Rhizobium meliloti TaxID=382 RepID=UPI0013E3D85F|nr:hypothetical protein [Sinorhizobium meliloti]QND29502.1 hypothetical protein HB773_31825 [Sinorhizobium meliloti]